MAKQTFKKGTSVDIRAHFTDPANNDADLDPTSLQLVIRAPDATVSTIAIGNITKEAVGKYLYILLPSQEGTYNWRWEAGVTGRSIVLEGAFDSERQVEF